MARGKTTADGAVPLKHHSQEKDVREFPGCLIIFAKNEAVSDAFRKERRIVHLRGHLIKG